MGERNLENVDQQELQELQELEFSSESNLQEREEKPKTEYKMLTQQGAKNYRNMQASSIKKFFLWSGIGAVGGITLASTIGSLPLKNKSPRKLRNYRIGSFLFIFTTLNYHGYKLAMRDFKIGRKKIVEDPQNLV